MSFDPKSPITHRSILTNAVPIISARMIALAAGVALLLLPPLIRDMAFDFMGGSAEVRLHGETYFNWRIWSAPFALANYCFLGWFAGQARAGLAFTVQLFLNLTNMALSVLFVLGLGMTSDGVGLAALLAEISAALLGGTIAFLVLKRMSAHLDWAGWNGGRLREAATMSISGLSSPAGGRRHSGVRHSW